MKYEVWMGFKNYKGDVYDVTKIAEFISEARARQYVDLCESTPYDTEDDTEVYEVREKGARR